jgi:hypothetical protein
MPTIGSIVRDSTFGAVLGRGIDGGSGSIRGEAVDFAPATPSAEGQSSFFRMKKVETLEDISDSFQMSIDGEAQFSMFGGSDKFNFVKEQKVHNFHLYLFVHVVVTNPPVVLSNTRLKPPAFDLIAKDTQRFHEEFGDFFVLGTQSGGEYAALLDIHTSDVTEHEALSNELDAAGFGGGFAFSAEAKVAVDKCRHLSTATVDITEMQIGGQADPTPVTAAGIIDKAENFRQTAAEHGVTLKVLLQNYEALDLPPGANTVDLQTQKTVLNDCFKQSTALQQALNSVEFMLTNPDQFQPPAAGVDLNQFRDQLATAINTYDKAASACLSDFRQCQLVVPHPTTPDLRTLPARQPGVTIFKGTWVNDDAQGILKSLEIALISLQQATIAGSFKDPPNQVVANGSWDNDAQALSVFLVTSPAASSGTLFHPASGHALQIRLGEKTGVKLSVTDAVGSLFDPSPPVLLSFSRVV